MKKVICAVCAGVVIAIGVQAAEKPVVLETNEQKLSYAMGLDLGAYFKQMDENFDLKALHLGVTDAYNGITPKLTDEEAVAIQQEFAQRQQQKQVEKTVGMVKKNNEAEELFLKENKTKEGIVETESGLQYKVITEGTGKKPVPSDTVQVHYKGSLLDGTEFDSSYTRNEPAAFRVDQVIPGWQEAVPLMAVGSTYELYIPAKLAYGDRGAPPVIEPGSMLIFQVELLDIKKNDN